MPTKDDTRFINKAIARLLKELERIEQRPDKCWLWPVPNPENFEYGRITTNLSIEGKQRSVGYLVHRLSMHHFKQMPILSSDCVCHKCDTPACFNPDHLFLGSHYDNVLDCINKGRRSYLRHFDRHTSKMQPEDIPAIMKLLPSCTNVEIAERMPDRISEHMVGNLRTGQEWSEFTGIDPDTYEHSDSYKKAITARYQKRSRGEGNPAAKLNWDKVAQIRAEPYVPYGKEVSLKDLSVKYGVSMAVISDVIRHKTWKNKP